ncbi:MAG: hypothetical protein AB1563_06895 [Bacillota bacterium]
MIHGGRRGLLLFTEGGLLAAAVTVFRCTLLLTYVGLAALFAEWLDNPAISLRSLGWRRDLERTRRLIRDFAAFSAQEVHGVARAILSGPRRRQLS